MDPLHCRASSFSSSSSGKTSDSKHVVSSEEFVIENFDKAIDCWELPKISKEKIYRTKKLDFWKNDYVIKTEERDITLSKPFETINLFSEKSLNKLKEKNFNYIHIGLIQIGIKPLTKEGLDTSILAVLRNGRFISFDDSLLSSIESSLCKGPISFDCYPNITLSLKDKNILKSMILQIKTHNYHMIEGSIPVALIFKISYKAMITAFSTQHKFQSKRDETLLLQTDLSRANTVIPKPIQWKDVNLPEEWILEGAAPPAIPKQLEPNTELQNVTQYSDGKVKLSFRRSNSSRFSDKASCSSIPSLERKFTKVPSVINLPFQSQPRKKTTEWKLFDSNRTVDSEHPPLRSVIIDHGEPPVEVRASPYKIPKPNDPEINLSSIIQQNNFCNTNLNTIGKQLTRLENQFQQSTISVSPSPKPVSLKSDSDKKLKEPIFKPFQVSKTSQKLVHESKSDFAKAIREQLDRIEAASSSSSKVQIAPDTPQLSRIGVLDQDQVSIASSNLEAFTEEPIPKANKIHWELALPTSKSPPDLTIDNRPSALNQARYNASSVYEWNIDGMSEYNILGVLQQMTMAANAYKTQSGTSDRAIAEILIAGFTGCCCYPDIDHFSPFHRLFLRDDANHVTWKEKFLAGLPTLLGEKVRNSIKALFENRIPYDELTYGELVSFVNKEGLKICQDLKLQKRLKQELRKSKQELGGFCKQFNYDPFKASTSKDCNGHTARFCKMNRRLHELGLEEEILSKIAPLLVGSSDSESSSSGNDDPLQVDELFDSDSSASSNSDSDSDNSYLKKINVLTKDQEIFLELVKHISDPNLQKDYLDKLLKSMNSSNIEASSSKIPIVKKNSYDLTEILDKKKTKKSAPNIQDLQKEVMAPKIRRDKGKAPASQESSKEPQVTPSKEKLLSSAMSIKSWIELVEEHEAKYKSISSEDQVKQWMSSITKSPELMIALQSLSQVQPKEEEKPTSKDISKPSSQNIVVSGESSSSQIVLSQPTPSKKTSDWFDKAHFQNIISMEDEFYHSDPFQSISKFFPQGWFFKP
ncbi:hypothetical protein KPL71_026142 [Citrus sinensis]|uniref:Uncharacterized protein n=1 Tax=Citrus sinensis TaxID=2711 RepID=A0ACB8HXB4_CITSI|nr:hypothetical protein KPL71_026142 [Citrus sinensis]